MPTNGLCTLTERRCSECIDTQQYEPWKCHW